MVLLPKSSVASEVKLQSQLLMKQLVERLASTGYSTIAFSHVIYGRPRTEDSVDALLQLPVSASQQRATNESTSEEQQASKRSRVETQSRIRIVKRLHAVVENLSDVGVYSKTNAAENAATLSILQDYDLVSLAPRNEATFQASCSASEADIVTLDYTAGRGGVQLPFRIRASDVRALVQRGAAFELHYAPALLNIHQRKALVQTARSLQMASIGVRPKPLILFSSGDRTVTGDVDMGAMALRSPGDLINLQQTVLGLDASVSHDALGASATRVFERGRLRKLGQLEKCEMIDVCMESDFVDNSKAAVKKQGKKQEASVEIKHLRILSKNNRTMTVWTMDSSLYNVNASTKLIYCNNTVWLSSLRPLSRGILTGQNLSMIK